LRVVLEKAIEEHFLHVVGHQVGHSILYICYNAQMDKIREALPPRGVWRIYYEWALRAAPWVHPLQHALAPLPYLAREAELTLGVGMLDRRAEALAAQVVPGSLLVHWGPVVAPEESDETHALLEAFHRWWEQTLDWVGTVELDHDSGDALELLYAVSDLRDFASPDDAHRGSLLQQLVALPPLDDIHVRVLRFVSAGRESGTSSRGIAPAVQIGHEPLRAVITTLAAFGYVTERVVHCSRGPSQIRAFIEPLGESYLDARGATGARWPPVWLKGHHPRQKRPKDHYP
jgi:hypothetical protein